MRNLISSLKNQNEQLKGDVLRYKRKLKDAQGDITKVLFISKYTIDWFNSIYCIW